MPSWAFIISAGAVAAAVWYTVLLETPKYDISSTKAQTPGLVLMPLPNYGFDPSEAAVPWLSLTEAGHRVEFATEDGSVSAADQLVLDGYMLKLLGIHPGPRAAYEKMIQDKAFRNPIAWKDIDPSRYDGLVLPGGHDKAMIEYLTSKTLHAKIAEFWALKPARPVGAVCHGILALARARNGNGESVLRNEKTTVVPRWMERLAYLTTVAVYGSYHLDTTWPTYTQDLVEAELASPDTQMDIGGYRLSDVFLHGTKSGHKGTHVVESGRYLSARFPGDVYAFGQRFATMVTGNAKARKTKVKGKK